jgi:hypothetical protein
MAAKKKAKKKRSVSFRKSNGTLGGAAMHPRSFFGGGVKSEELDARRAR